MNALLRVRSSEEPQDGEEPLPERRRFASVRKLELAPFTELLKKYNVTDRHTFSECYGEYAKLAESLVQKEGTRSTGLHRGRQKPCKRILLIVLFNRPHYTSIISSCVESTHRFFTKGLCLPLIRAIRITLKFSEQDWDLRRSPDFISTWLCQRS